MYSLVWPGAAHTMRRMDGGDRSNREVVQLGRGTKGLTDGWLDVNFLHGCWNAQGVFRGILLLQKDTKGTSETFKA